MVCFWGFLFSFLLFVYRTTYTFTEPNTQRHRVKWRFVPAKIPANYFRMQKVAFSGRERNTHKNTQLIVNRNRCQGTLGKMIKMVFCTFVCWRPCSNPPFGVFNFPFSYGGCRRWCCRGLLLCRTMERKWSRKRISWSWIGGGVSECRESQLKHT